MKKHTLYDGIFDSFALIFKNLLLFAPDILYFIVTALLLALFVYLNNLFVGLSFDPSLLAEQLKSQMQTLVSSTSLMIKLIASFIVLLLVNILVGISLISIRYAMIKRLMLNKMLRIRVAYNESKKYTLSLVGIKILLFFMYTIPLLVVIPLFTSVIDSSVLGLILLALVYAIFYIIFFFVYPILYLNKTRNPFKVLKDTFAFCKNNIKYSFIVILTVLVISLVIGFISSYISSQLTILFSGVAISWLSWCLLGLLFLLIKLISILLTLWTQTFSFIMYKARK